jgi:hypothetical protein
VIVRVEDPVGAGLLVFTVNVEVPVPVRLLGVKVALVRCGSPLTLSDTVPVNPVPPIVTV